MVGASLKDEDVGGGVSIEIVAVILFGIDSFADGNGRTARAVAYFLIFQWLEVLIRGRLSQ